MSHPLYGNPGGLRSALRGNQGKPRNRCTRKQNRGVWLSIFPLPGSALEVDGQVEVGGDRARFAQRDVRIAGDLGHEPLISRHDVDRRAAPGYQCVRRYAQQRSGLFQDVTARRVDLLERFGPAQVTLNRPGFGNTHLCRHVSILSLSFLLSRCTHNKTEFKMLTPAQMAVKRKQDKVTQITLLCRFCTDTIMTLTVKHHDSTQNPHDGGLERQLPDEHQSAPGELSGYSGKALP